MKWSVMLDLETLSTNPEAVVLTIGAVKFIPGGALIDTDNSLYERISVDEQLALNRDVSESTIEWWGKQADDVREEALGDGNRISLSDFVAKLNKFVVGTDCIWSQGSFDINILENLYRQLGQPVPWNYWQIRDSRTLFGVFGDPREKGKKGLHNALEDVISQANAVQEVLRKYKG